MTRPDTALARCAAASALVAGSGGRRPRDAAFYLAHVEGATPLRRLAEVSGAPVSTVHRAVRRVEALRDDPLIDLAFDALGDAARAALAAPEEAPVSPIVSADAAAAEGRHATHRIAHRALEKLAEPESFLMVARGATKAGVFCRKNRFRRPLALLTVETAAEFAARDWVRCASRTAVSSKYVITEAGRAWLRRVAAEAAPARAGAEAEVSPYAAQHRLAGERVVAREDGRLETIRVNLGESPLGWLARRRGADGEAFLDPVEVEAGERLREDFEMAQMGPRVTQDWRGFLTPRDSVGQPSGPWEGPRAARERVSKALSELGAGLADVAFRTCCMLEGLEATERRMGWSARSGKVVLKIALQRLAAHYGLVRPATA